MDDLYLSGVIFSFFIGLIKIGIAISAISSVRAGNLKKIGLYYSGINGTFTTSKPSVLKFTGFFAYMVLLAPIFSWLSVASAAWSVIHWLNTRSSIPEAVKIIQYKIAHVNLSKEQMISAQEEISKVLGMPSQIRVGAQEENEAYDTLTLVLDHGEWYSEIVVDPTLLSLKSYGHTPDYDSIFHSQMEYKIEGETILIRLINDYTDNYGKESWHVRDGVVLESEIRNRHDTRFNVISVDEELEKYRSQTVWYLLKNYTIKFFIMSKHSNLFPPGEFRRLVRTELEKLKLATAKFNCDVTAMGIEVIEGAEGFDFRYPDYFPEQDRKRVEALFSKESLNSYGISVNELNTFKEIQTELMKLLGDRNAA